MQPSMSKDKHNDDNDLFRQMMADVKPLSGNKSADNRVDTSKPRPVPKRRVPSANTTGHKGFAPRELAPDVAPEDALFFARSGLQTRLLRQLKRGDLRPEARLDLHGQTLAEASSELAAFLDTAQNDGLRCICVVHGKGHRSAEGRPVLKTQINQWLRDTPAVLAFSSAQPKDGGKGALYVLLRRHQIP